MADRSAIEWTDATWNPVTGCSPVSEGCEHCYASRMAKRLAGRHGYPAGDGFSVTLHPEKLGEPVRWQRGRRIFVVSMGDLFHHHVPDEYIARVWFVMGMCAGLIPERYREHRFLILTKRPRRMRDWLRGWADLEQRRRWVEANGEVFDWMDGPRYWPAVLPNVWPGVTAENQARADERIPVLLQIPAVVHWVSVEPCLGSVDVGAYLCKTYVDGGLTLGRYLDWVVCGGETGPRARPMRPAWPRSLRDQCQAVGVPFFFKSWGEWAPVHEVAQGWHCLSHAKGNEIATRVSESVAILENAWDGSLVARVGKARAGHLLDGREWRQYPR